MNFFIVFFLLSIFGIKILLHLNENKKSWNTILDYLCLTLFSNYFCMSIVALSNKLEMNLVNYIENNCIFSIKYISLMLITNLFLAVFFTVIKKYFVLSVEV